MLRIVRRFWFDLDATLRWILFDVNGNDVGIIPNLLGLDGMLVDFIKGKNVDLDIDLQKSFVNDIRDTSGKPITWLGYIRDAHKIDIDTTEIMAAQGKKQPRETEESSFLDSDFVSADDRP